MKNFFTKALCLTFVLLMLVPSIVACKDDTPDDTVGGSESSTTTDVVETNNNNKDDDDDGETESSKYDVYDNLGEMDFEGQNVTILQCSLSDYENEIKVDRLTGDLVNDAIYKRNAAVEKRLNLHIHNKLAGTSVYSVTNTISSALQAGTADFQLASGPNYTMCNRITEGVFHNLNQLDNLDLDQPYWAGFLNETVSIGGAQYVASGAISLSFYKFMFVTTVNNRILAEDKEGAPDLIQVVKDGKWTIEYQTQLTSKYYTDMGAGGKDDDDIFGFVTNNNINADAYVSSCEVRFLSKGDDGYYYWDFDLSRATSAMDDLVELYTQNSTYCYSSEYDDVVEKFASGEALMAQMRLYEVEGASIRDMKDEYMILPVPRYSEDQEGYYSLLSDRFTSVMVPKTLTLDEANEMAAVLEAMASESYRTVTPAYFEIVLRSRLLDDADNWDIMEMMTQSVKMDAALPYTAAIEFKTGSNNTLIKRWRYVLNKSYQTGATSEMASAYSYEEVQSKVEAKLNTLQTYIKNQIANQ